MTSAYKRTVYRNYVRDERHGDKDYFGRLKDGTEWHVLNKRCDTATAAEQYAWRVRDRLNALRKVKRDSQIVITAGDTRLIIDKESHVLESIE